MSLDDIQLPPILIARLFKDSLVTLKSGQALSQPGTAGKISFLGGNKNGLIILVDEPSVLFLPDTQLVFLMDILKACRMGMEDVAMVNLHSQKLGYKTLEEELKPRYTILFGLQPQQIDLPITFPEYQLQSYNQQVFLSVPKLDILEKNREEKTKLWTSLKKLFSI